MKQIFTRLAAMVFLLVGIQQVSFATANYVYHEASTNNPGCGSDNYRSVLTPNSSQALTITWKVEFQFYTDNVRIYYTTDGSTPAGAFGVGSGTTQVVTGSYSCNFSSGGIVDVAKGTIPAQLPGTTVKYIVSAWHSGGGDEIFANGPSATCSCGTPTNNSTLATLYSYTVTPASNVMVYSTGGTGAPSTGYTTLAAALTAINGGTAHTGTITAYVTNGYTETAPAGGYSITATGTSGSPIIIKKASSGGTNPVITAGVGTSTTNDAIIKIIGGDYITIDGFTLQEAGTNVTATTQVEWGIALLHASVTNGCQNNTIQNNTITLNKTNLNTWGIYSNNRHSATAPGTTEDITNNTTGPNNNNKVYGNIISNTNMGIAFIGCSTAANQDSGNDIGGVASGTGNTITNWGGAAASGSYISNTGTSYCIFMNHQIGDNVSYNTITSATLTGTAVTTRGILKDYTTTAPTGTFTSSITNNTITITDNFTSGTLECIRSQGMTTLSTATVNINSNIILNTSVGGASSSTTIVGIVNSSVPGVLSMSSNIIRGTTSTATTGGFTGVSNTGAVVTTININNNQIGNASGNAITFSAATSGALLGVNNTGGASTAALSITGNDFRGIVHSVAGSSTHTYIINSATTLSQNISSNTFTNLTVNTTAGVTFISNSVNAPTSGFKNINSNSIVTGFNKTGAGGTVALYNDGGSSTSTTSHQNNNNNFSNITLTGATIITGWFNNDGTGSTPPKTITGNTFSNWTCGTSAVNVLQSNFGGTASISNNTISSITGQGSVTALLAGSSGTITTMTIANNVISGISSTGTGGAVTGISTASPATTANINGNVVSGLSSTGAVAVIGVVTSASATTSNVFKNKIYDISGSNGSTTVNGLLVSGGTTVNIYNNLVGDLRASIANASNPVIGLSVTGGTTVNAYYNTIHLNASSTGALFGSSAVSVSTTPTVTLRNNIFVNNSSVTGAGLSVAYRRSGTTLTSYGSASNNNLFYATSAIYTDGTNTDVGMTAYKSRVSTRDAASVSETITPATYFQSLTGSNANYLHLVNGLNTYAESGGSSTGLSATYTDDYDGNTRQGSAGYAGAGTAPDIGADEFAGVNAAAVPTNVGAFALAAPLATGCYTSSETVSITVKNYGTAIVDFSVNPMTITVNVTGAVTTTLSATVNTGTLAIGATANYPVSPALNMSTAGTYTFNATATVTGDGNASDDAMPAATRTVIATVALPYTQDFSGGVFPANWTNTSSWSVATLHGNTNYGIYKNIYSTTNTAQFDLVKLGTVSATDNFTFDYRLVNFSGYPATALPNSPAWGSITILVSTDCGGTFSTFQTINASNHTSTTSWATKSYSLSAYAGQQVIFRMKADWLAGDYYVDFDNFKVQAPPAIDMGATALVAPLTTGCYSATETVTVTVRNFGSATLDFSVTPLTVTTNVTGAATATLSATVSTGTLAPSATLNVPMSATLNMSAGGIYTFNSSTTITGDGDATNNAMSAATRTGTAIVATPYTQDFSGGVFPANWTNTSFWNIATTHGNTNYGIYMNLYSTTTTAQFDLVKAGIITAADNLSFDYRVVNYSSYPATATPNSPAWGTITIQVSTDCGGTFSTFQTINNTNHTSTTNWATKLYSLSAYAGQQVIFRIKTDWLAGDYYIDFDNFSISSPITDIGVLGLAAPVATSGCYSASENISVTIKNYGTLPWDFTTASKNGTITANVTGAATASFPLVITNNSYNGGLPLAAGATMTVPLGTLDMRATGVYTFNAGIAATDDATSSNNAMTAATRTSTNPSITSISSNTPVCAGSPLNLFSTVSAGGTLTALSENFNSGAPTWTKTNTSTGTTPSAAAWTARPNGYDYFDGSDDYIFNSNDNSQFMLSNSDAIGTGASTLTTLTSPSFSTVGFSTLTLSFYHHYENLTSGTAEAFVEVSTNGTTWTTAQSYSADAGLEFSFVNTTVNLNAYVGNPTLYLRFRYQTGWGFWWAIDNVNISGVNTSATYAWTGPSYTSGVQNPVIAVSSAANAGTYNLTATDAAGCASKPASTTVVVNTPVNYYVDGDGDGYGAGSATSSCTVLGAGYSTNNTDCNDALAAVHPGATETCNGVDDDCAGGIDNGLTFTNYYTDADGDGYGAGSATSLCADPGAGYSTNNTDCDDTNGAIHVNGDFYTDADGDGYGTGSLVSVCYSGTGTPSGYATNNTDCDDANGAIHSPVTYYVDGDGDGYGSASAASYCQLTAPSGYSANSTDCNDLIAAVNPGASEVCNGVDDDCDGATDSADPSVTGEPTWYADADGDGFGDASSTAIQCGAPLGYVANSTDCNDADNTVHTPQLYYVDGDGDGYGSATTAMICSSTAPAGYATNNTDCDDANAAIHSPVTYYVDADGDGYGSTTTGSYCQLTAPSGYSSDNTDCDDADNTVHTPQLYYVDGDGDGYGSASTAMLCSSTAPAGYATNNTDCDDTNAAIHVNGNFYTDADGDGYGTGSLVSVCYSGTGTPAGYSTNNTDCDDANAAINSPVTYYVDADGDGYGSSTTGSYCQLTAPSGYSTDNTDCNDADAAVHTPQVYYTDADGDGYGAGSAQMLCSAAAPTGYSVNATDCNDADENVHPGATDVCNGTDDDCDASVDEDATFVNYYVDADADGYGDASATPESSCSPVSGSVTNNTDCNDADNTVHTPQLYYVDGDGDGYGSATTAMLCSSTAPTGYSTNNTDCDDANAAIHSPVTYYVDGDGDGYGSSVTGSYCQLTAPAGYSSDNTDCDDADNTVHTPQLYYVDGDGDGYGSTTTAMLCSSTAPGGYATNNTDCDDANAAINSPVTYYVDSDGDGYGSAVTGSYCQLTAPAGYSTDNTDCDDADAAVHTGMPYYVDADGDGYGAGSIEYLCSAIAPAGYSADGTDCDDADNTVHTPQLYYVDGDGDGYGSTSTAMLCSSTAPAGYATNNTDCDDTNGAIHVNGDFYTDADGDGYGTGSLVSVCYSGTGTPSGYSTDNTDCDDADAAVHTPQLYYVDGDGDGYGSATTAMLCSATAPSGYSADNTDCDDADADVYPGATEVCNAVDDDCDASVDEDLTLITYYADADGDTYGDASAATTTCSATPPSGYVTDATDCNDADAAVHAPQAYYADGDGDGYGAGTASMMCSATAPMGYTADNTDCDDDDAGVYPGATEVCNSVDDDCDASVDEDLTLNTYYADADGDTYGDGGTTTTSCSATAPLGYVANADDCDDTDSSVNPDGTEICNGLDDDCDGDFDEGTVSASITPSGSVTVCKSSTTPLTANSGAGYTYQWFRNGHIIAGATGSVYNAVKQGNYTVQVNSAGGCFATSAVTKIIFLPAVNANITTPNGTDLCVATNVKLKASAQPGYTWQWYRNGNPLAGQTNYLLNVTMTSFGPGNYKCLITNTSGCSGFTPTVSVTHPCREGEENFTRTAEADMEIYPNPTSAAFTLDMTVPGVADGVADITVYNMMGQQVMQLTEAVSDAHMMRTITFDNAATVGVYFVKVLVNGTEYTQQVVLVR